MAWASQPSLILQDTGSIQCHALPVGHYCSIHMRYKWLLQSQQRPAGLESSTALPILLLQDTRGNFMSQEASASRTVSCMLRTAWSGQAHSQLGQERRQLLSSDATGNALS